MREFIAVAALASSRPPIDLIRSIRHGRRQQQSSDAAHPIAGDEAFWKADDVGARSGRLRDASIEIGIEMPRKMTV
jgi:hypothetical protein